jgi:hypothetical protein
MTPTTPGYALIGRSFTRDAFESLYQASIATRQRERGGIWALGHPVPSRSAWLTTPRAPVSPTAAL